MFSTFLSKFQKFLGKSKAVASIAIKIRNKANIIIGYSITTTHDHNNNGEKWIIHQLKDSIRTFIDVGANKGNWTNMVLDIIGLSNIDKAYLFEPANYTFELLVSKYSGEPKINCIKKALSDKNGTLKFYEEPDAGESSSLLKEFSNQAAIEIMVDVTNIDTIFELENIEKTDYLKIDCEGFDFFVIRGSEMALQSKKIKYLQFEYGDGWQYSGGTLTAAIKILTNHGYHTYAINPNKLIAFDKIPTGEYFRYSNFIASVENLNYLV